MIKIYGSSETSSASKVKKAKSAGNSFAPAAANAGAAGTTQNVAKTASAQMMDALLDLQGSGGGSAKTYAAAQRTLDLLERLQMKLLDGEASQSDLEALARAAQIRAHAEADRGLLDVYDQIALRARVEMAKLGR